MNRFFTYKTTAASLLRGLLLLSIMMLTSVGTWVQAGEPADSTTVSISVSDAAALKNALESDTISTIYMTTDITLAEEVKITVGADHTLSIAEGKTLTCTVKYGIFLPNNNDSNISLTIQGEGEGSKLVINVDGGGNAITSGTLILKNITVDITSGIIDPTYLTVGTGATINVDAANQDSPLSISKLTVDNGGTINIKTFKRVGININAALTINSGGTVKVGNGTGDNRGILIRAKASIVLNGGTLEGTGEDKGGNIYLQANAKVTGMSSKLVDQGKELSENGEVTVVEENTAPSTTSLSEGAYTWDKSSSKFAKPDLNEGYTLSETGALTISSQTGMTNWRQNGRGSNYSKVKSVTITGNVTEIVENAFASCSNLTQVTITANEITGIGAAAFQNTKSLTTIQIPASVTTIGDGAFSGSGISTFTVAEGNKSFKADADKALLTYDGKTLFAFAPKATGSYTIPDGVVTIGNSSFQNTALTSLEIPGTVTSIGEDAFALSALTSIVIPSSVETIGEAAFVQSALTSIVIPESVTTIGNDAFMWSVLTTVTFEGTEAPTIGTGIFGNCPNLTGIFVPANATGYTGDGASENWKTWSDKIKVGQGQTQTEGENTVPDGGTLIGNGQTEATKVTPEGDATFENVKTQATEVADGTTSNITLTGTSNDLGAITVGSNGSLSLTANESTSVTVASVDNSGAFADNTGSVTKVTGEASLDLSADDAMPSDHTATGQVTLTAKPAVAEGADVSYQWQKQENGSWTDVSNPYTRATVAGSPDFTTNISGMYRCRITVGKGGVSTTLLTLPATATVNSIPDPDPEPTYYTVTLPSVEGAATDPVAGSYDVESSDNFRFYLTLDADYNQSVPVVTTSRGETITPRTSDGAYIVKYVHSDLVISIGGIAKNPPPVANAEIQSGTRIFTRDGSLFIITDRPARAQVFALTGQLIRSLDLPVGTTHVDALATGVYIVRLDDGMTRKVIIGR